MSAAWTTCQPSLLQAAKKEEAIVETCIHLGWPPRKVIRLAAAEKACCILPSLGPPPHTPGNTMT